MGIAIRNYLEGKGENHEKGITIDKGLFPKDPVFAASAFGIILITAGLYAIFW